MKRQKINPCSFCIVYSLVYGGYFQMKFNTMLSCYNITNAYQRQRNSFLLFQDNNFIISKVKVNKVT